MNEAEGGGDFAGGRKPRKISFQSGASFKWDGCGLEAKCAHSKRIVSPQQSCVSNFEPEDYMRDRLE